MPEDNSFGTNPETPAGASTEKAIEYDSRYAQDSQIVEAVVEDAAEAAQAAKPQTTKDIFVAEEYGDSFSALARSMEQGYDLKMKRKAFDEYTNTLNTLKNAYNDRLNIAQNFNALVEEQQHIIEKSSVDVESCNDRVRQIESQIAAKNDEFARLKKDQAQALKPFEDELARCETVLASAKDEFKQVKQQRDSLDLFDATSQDTQSVQDSHDRIVADVEAKYESAKTAQKDAQRALDAQAKANKAEQRRMSDEIKKLNSEKAAAVKETQEHQKRVDAANERIAFCNHVIAHPEETERMQQRITENEATAAEMNAQIEQLASVHAQSVKASSKARGVIIAAAVFIVIVIILFFVVGNR